MFNIIQKITLLPDHRLGLLYQDGAAVIVDFKPLIAEGGVFAPLAAPAFFAQVQLGPRGRFIVWPGDPSRAEGPLVASSGQALDFCADSLWLDGQPADPSQIEAESLAVYPA